MRRLLLLVAAVCAFAAIAAVGAKGSTAYTATLVAPPASVVDQTMVISGTLTGPAVGGAYGELRVYDNAQCTFNGESYYVTDSAVADDGGFGFSVVSDEAGTWWVAADVYVGEDMVTTNCVEATFTTEVVAPPKPASSFLCWNREMTDPVVYEDPVADTMWATGKYFEPQAILGNVVGGTNMGAYHLVCNAPATMKPTGEGIGGSGEVYSAGTMILYHLQHTGGNDLNLYHIYK